MHSGLNLYIKHPFLITFLREGIGVCILQVWKSSLRETRLVIKEIVAGKQPA